MKTMLKLCIAFASIQSLCFAAGSSVEGSLNEINFHGSIESANKKLFLTLYLSTLGHNIPKLHSDRLQLQVHLKDGRTVTAAPDEKGYVTFAGSVGATAKVKFILDLESEEEIKSLNLQLTAPVELKRSTTFTRVKEGLETLIKKKD